MCQVFSKIRAEQQVLWVFLKIRKYFVEHKYFTNKETEREVN